jgi:hypothetical protein
MPQNSSTKISMAINKCSAARLESIYFDGICKISLSRAKYNDFSLSDEYSPEL